MKPRRLTQDDLRHREQWINIAIMVVFLSGMLVAYGIGLRIGSSRGEAKAIAYVSNELAQKLDKKCFDKLSKAYEEQ